MTYRIQSLTVTTLCLALAGSTAALAEPTPKPRTQPKENEAKPALEITQATAEMIMNEAVKNIAKRYNLNEAQRQKTDDIMKRDVNKFLKDHEAQVWPIIREFMSGGFQPPSDPEDVKRLGRAAAPLLKDAQKAILDGNREWRQYLTPEQQKMHDFDLAEMDKQFVEAEKNLQAWAEGRPRGGLFPAPSLDRSPPTPPMPKPGLPQPPAPPEPQVEIFVRESLFDTYVEDFIKQYELDPAQIESARSILAEYKQKAGAFKEANRAELTKVAYEHKAAVEGNDRERIAQAEAERKRLLQPAYEMFGAMDERLKALLTTAQRARHGEQAASKIDPIRDIDPHAGSPKKPAAEKSEKSDPTPPPADAPRTPPATP
jgi:hypothetical protein